MKTILVATEKPFAPVAIEKIRRITENAGYNLGLLEKYSDPADLVKAVEKADALIVRSDLVTSDVLAAGKQLKIVVRAGAGYDNIDLQSATGQGVVVMNTPGQNSNAVAELALGMMVYFARNMFNGKPGTELLGKTLGIHGCGNVGKQVARIARGFGMAVYACDPPAGIEAIKNAGASAITTVEDLYRSCQYILLSLPAKEKTKKMVNFHLLSLMPEGATLVNTARKEIICEESLLKMFAGRPDFAYLSDVEPDCKEQIAASWPGRYFFTPKKMGAQTQEANINAGVAAAAQIVDFFEKGDTRFQVNK